MALEDTKKQDHRRSPSWMLTFADLMALLVALFVLILSFAEFDVDRFMKNTGPIAEAFNSKRDEIPFTRLQLGAPIPSTSEKPQDEFGDHDLEWILDTLDMLERTLSAEIQNGRLAVKRAVDGVIVTLHEDTAFASGSSRLSPRATAILTTIGEASSNLDGRIVVSGHTDRSAARDGSTSNWALSATRAAAVVDYLLANSNIQRGRILAQGFADSRPVNEGLTPADQAANRRVEILFTQARETR